jgi:Domain of unknown function (DUF1707)
LRTPQARGSLEGVDRRGHLRASDEDRENVVDRLRRAATEGRIASEELEHRVSAALKARTYRELEATVADLPGPARQRSRRSGPVVTLGRWIFATLRANPLLGLLLLPVVAVVLAVIVALTLLFVAAVTVVLLLSGRPRFAAWGYGRQPQRSVPRGHAGNSWI